VNGRSPCGAPISLNSSFSAGTVASVRTPVVASQRPSSMSYIVPPLAP
jgi:hypothetical protein